MSAHARDKTRHTPFQAVILDLDGVITHTARLHAAAWKQTFDELLAAIDPNQPPFDEQSDYLNHVDGKPRYDGVRDFLASRGIELPEGAEEDTIDDRTVAGVGATKNQRFRALVRERGADVFEDTTRRLREWRERGLALAVVSSSRNCADILESAKLSELFDARVDGETLRELDLPGKPAPDMYLEAARRIGVEPQKAVVVEDAIAGVQAAAKGGFGLVVGVHRSGGEEQLSRSGADIVVSNLDELDLDTAGRADAPPDALRARDAIRARLEDSAPALFLDYDGTLTPIVERPELATLDDSMRAAIRALAQRCPVAIVSGRDRADVAELVDLPDLVYAGSHGFDIAGPEGLHIEHSVGSQAIPKLDRLERRLRSELEEIDGAQLERKRFSIAVHYRNVAEAEAERVEGIVDDALSGDEELRKGRGKKVFEIQPDVDWNKGRAVLWLLETLDLDRSDVLPIYIGDDVTDEDAFEALEDRGIGIVVDQGDRSTKAEYALADTDSVRQLLEWITKLLAERAR